MKFKNPYWSILTKIEMLQKWIVVQCILYYELNMSIAQDHVYDANVRQIQELILRYPEEARKSRWYYLFKGFNKASGFNLFSKLNTPDKMYLMDFIDQLLKYNEKRR